MRANRLGCFSSTGILATIITTLVITGYAYARGGSMYNPGPLNAQQGQMLGGVTSHAGTGGECETCHTAPWEAAKMADRCISCHTEIAEQMQNIATVHSTISHNDPGLGCRHCHPEHRGPEASLTVMDEASFPHEALGFSLKGHQHIAAGRSFQCDDCHQGDLATFTPQTCDTCHRQTNQVFMTAHTLSFGSACLDCHDGVDRFGQSFDHNAFSFPLTGQHADLACSQCHFNTRGLGDFAVTSQDCYSCHHADDPHESRFGTDCATCHTADVWTPAAFDHNLSNFPLTGAHVNVACEQCHTNGQFEGLNTACNACHAEPESHAGQFGTDCAACHTTTTWIPAAFNGQHTFPLDHGDGGVTSCATCHPASLTTYTCYGCHEHNEAEVRAKHLEEGIGNFQNCMECHPTGEEHEGGEGHD